jgi:hypothetical protein
MTGQAEMPPLINILDSFDHLGYFKPQQKLTKENKHAKNKNNEICTHSISAFTLDHFCGDTGNEEI